MKNTMSLENYGVVEMTTREMRTIDGGSDPVDGFDSWTEIDDNAGVDLIAFTAGLVSLVAGGVVGRVAGVIGWLAYK